MRVGAQESGAGRARAESGDEGEREALGSRIHKACRSRKPTVHARARVRGETSRPPAAWVHAAASRGHAAAGAEERGEAQGGGGAFGTTLTVDVGMVHADTLTADPLDSDFRGRDTRDTRARDTRGTSGITAGQTNTKGQTPETQPA